MAGTIMKKEWSKKNSNMKFEDLVYNKKVLLIGPASYLYDGNFKEDLDNYDTVVKLNRMVETKICKNFVNDRCDILYHCVNFDTSIGEEPIEFEILKEEKVKCLKICYPPVSSWYVTKVREYNMLNAKHRFPTTIVEKEKYRKLFSLCQNTSPNTGTIAMYDLYSYNPKSLTIKGITMFSGGYNKNYRQKIVTEKEVRDLNARVKNHDIEKQKSFLRTFLNQEKIIIDSNLKESVYGKN